MDDDTIADLKQFIAATVNQNTSDIRGDISDIRTDISDIRTDIKKLDKKVDDLTEYVADAIDTSNEQNHKTLTNHEKRITKLEQKTA